MFDTDAKGFIHATGYLAGGHAILARAVKVVLLDKDGPRTFANLDRDASYVTLRNSWGRGFGIDGDCRMSVAGLDSRLREQGECCIPGKENAMK